MHRAQTDDPGPSRDPGSPKVAARSSAPRLVSNDRLGAGRNTWRPTAGSWYSAGCGRRNARRRRSRDAAGSWWRWHGRRWIGAGRLPRFRRRDYAACVHVSLCAGYVLTPLEPAWWHTRRRQRPGHRVRAWVDSLFSHPRPLGRGLRLSPRERRARWEVLHIVVHVLARWQSHTRVFHLAADRRQNPADGEPSPQRSTQAPLEPARQSLAGGAHRFDPPWSRAAIRTLENAVLCVRSSTSATSAPVPRGLVYAVAGLSSQGRNRPIGVVKTNNSVRTTRRARLQALR
jgi:hypothetical protein